MHSKFDGLYDLGRRLLLCSSLALLAGCAISADDSDEAGESNSAEQAVATSLNVMSLNVRIPDDQGENHWSQRLPRILRMIDRHKPHLIGVQELTVDTYPHMVAQLPKYSWYAINRGDGEVIAIAYDKARLQMLEANFRNVTNPQRDDSCSLTNPEDSANRPIQYVIVKDIQNNNMRYFYNTHFPSKHSCERKGMATILASYINGRAHTALPVVLVGDFNDGINQDGTLNTSFQDLITKTGLRNAYPMFNRTDSGGAFLTGHGYNKTARQGKMIDHILLSGTGVTAASIDRTMFSGVTAVNCPTVVNGLCPNGQSASSLTMYSDHWAVVASLTP